MPLVFYIYLIIIMCNINDMRDVFQCEGGG